MATLEDYVDAAVDGILVVLATEHAVTHPELEARLAQKNYRGTEGNINPHHITTALRQLRGEGILSWTSGPTRGGSTVQTISRSDTPGRQTLIEEAAARKRLLTARYNGWATGNTRHPHGLIGPAGEAAVRLGLAASAALQPAAPNFAGVTSLLGISLTGEADSAGYMVPILHGQMGAPVAIIIEVKNIRSWIYPASMELFQVLDKAAKFQLAKPEQAIVPVLACRMAHTTTFWMASQLGFIVIDMGRQFVGAAVDDDHLREVRNELHFDDLHKLDGPSLRIRDRFRDVLPPICTRVAHTWWRTVNTPGTTALFANLRVSKRASERAQLMDELRRIGSVTLGNPGGW